MATTTIPYDSMSTTSRSDTLFTKCCCCIPLRVGCLILGYFALIYNCFRTISIVWVTICVGIASHGFDHVDPPKGQYPEGTIDKLVLQEIEIILLVILLFNFAWLIINIACLVGLHKKRPGPIRVYVAFASIRLVLSLFVFAYLVSNGKTTTSTIVAHCIDLALTAYFILVYYIYAMQLEQEILQRLPGPGPDAHSINVVSFIYPKNISEKHLIA